MADRLSRKGETSLICMLTLPSPSWWDFVVDLHDEIKNMKLKAEKGELGSIGPSKREHFSTKIEYIY